jgi:hypothetical protein
MIETIAGINDSILVMFACVSFNVEATVSLSKKIGSDLKNESKN